MNSIGPVLEENFNSKIYIPGLSQRVLINNKFFFIACQNFSTTLGRKQFPTLLKKRLKIINYPENKDNNEIINEDFRNICVSINKEIENQKRLNCIKDEEAKKIGLFIQKFNLKKTGLINDLNLRDVKKLLKRIYFQNENKSNYIGFSIYSNIFFYILSQLPQNKYSNQLIHKEIIPLLANIFEEENSNKDKNIFSKNNKSSKIIKELENYFNGNFEITKNNYLKKIIMK